MAGDDDGSNNSSSVCSNPRSFLGVGNADCIGENLVTTTFLVAFIIILSILLDFLVLRIRKLIHCPQMRIIVNRIFEEVMVLGFITTVLFALGTTSPIFDLEDNLTPSESQHFKEFFHYVIFLSMIYYIFIVLLLLTVGTLIPKWLWHRSSGRTLQSSVDDYDATTTTTTRQSRIDIPELPSTTNRIVESYHHTYQRLREKFENQPWTFGCSIRRQFSLWKSFEILAFHLCRDRSRPIYSNPDEMQRIFKLSYKQSLNLDYEAYNTLCVRNMLANITSLHWSGFLNLICVVLVTSVFPEKNKYVFILIGVVLLALSVVIMIKTSRILRGIVKDRLKVMTQREIDNVALERKSRSFMEAAACHHDTEGDDDEDDESKRKKKRSFKTLAISVRAIIRMQLSALDHQALHYHDDRFWFKSPWFLLRLFQFATFGQAFYLVWFSLVQSLKILDDQYGWIKLIVTLLVPILSLLLVLPLTLPSLVLALSLTGFFVEQGRPRKFRKKAQQSIAFENREHMRRVRGSYLRNSRASDTGTEGIRSRRQSFSRQSFSRTPRRSNNNAGRGSPNSDVLLRQYDFPSPLPGEQIMLFSEDEGRSSNEGISPTKSDTLDVVVSSPVEGTVSTPYVECRDVQALQSNYCTGFGTYVTNSTQRAEGGVPTATTALAAEETERTTERHHEESPVEFVSVVDVPSPTAFKNKRT